MYTESLFSQSLLRGQCDIAALASSTSVDANRPSTTCRSKFFSAASATLICTMS